MKIGIYDKYLHTLGGGERYIASMARYLSDRGHEVQFITHTAVELERLEERFNISMAGLNLQILPEQPDEVLSDLTQEFDLFVNGTYFSTLPNQAQKSAIVIHFFPLKEHDYPIALKKACLLLTSLLLGSYIKEIQFGKGFYEMELNSHVYGHWSSKESTILFNEPTNFVSFKYKLPKGATLMNTVLNLEDDKNRKLEVNSTDDTMDISCPEGTKSIKFTCRPYVDSKDPRQLGVFIYSPSSKQFKISTRFLYLGLTKPKIKAVLKRLIDLHKRQVQFFSPVEDFVSTYDVIACNSSYGQKWLNILTKNKYTSHILYPPVGVEDFSPSVKQKQIVSVGRFFVGGHNKKQLEMIQFFKMMYDKNTELSEYKFILVGGVEDKPEHQEYVTRCIEAAKGYPIELKLNAKYSELKQAMEEAKYFWHAAGYGEDESKNPDKFEHFGITTVEAMAAGCIPIVIARGGQPEIIENGVNGFLWETAEELICRTVELVSGKYDEEKLAQMATTRCKDFSISKFNKRLDEIFEELL